jgi:hypothetical protein
MVAKPLTIRGLCNARLGSVAGRKRLVRGAQTAFRIWREGRRWRSSASDGILKPPHKIQIQMNKVDLDSYFSPHIS